MTVRTVFNRLTPRRSSLVFVGLGAITLAASSAAAQTASPAAAASSDVVAIDDIIVTARKTSEKLSEVGGGISAISGENLERLNASTLQDYLSFVPGVSFTSYGRPGQTQVVIRGIAPLALGSAIATYVDEIPVGSSSNEAQGSSYSPDIDPADLERVEVLKGPQGTLYGASSLGGVLKYVTRAPNLFGSDFSIGAELNSVEHGDVGYKLRTAGSIALIEDVLGVRGSVFVRRNAGFIDNPVTGAANVNQSDAWGLRLSTLYRPDERLSVKLGAVYQKTDSDGLNAVSYGAAPNMRPPFVLTGGDLEQRLRLSQPNRVEDQIYSTEINYDLGFASLVSATGYSHEDIYRFTDVTGTYTRPSYRSRLGLPNGATASLVHNYNITRVSEELRLQSAQPDARVQWTIGVFLQKETSEANGQVNIRDANFQLLPQPAGNASYQFADNELKEYAGFANATWFITPSIDVSAGYRRSHLSQSNTISQSGYVFTPSNPTNVILRTDTPVDDVDTYSLGARWRIDPSVMVYARAASGYRPGGGRALPPVNIPNFVYSYQPDTVWSYETGIKATAWNGRAAIDVNAFYLDWKDIQALIPANNDPFPFFIIGNGGDAVSKGIEGNFTLRPVTGLTLNLAAAYTDAYFAETFGDLLKGQQLQGVAKETVALQVEYRRPLGGSWDGFVGGNYRYRSSMIGALDEELPEYDQVGLHAGFENDDMRLSLFVTNLTDERGLLGYTGGGNQVGDPYRYAVVQPRTVGMSVTRRW